MIDRARSGIRGPSSGWSGPAGSYPNFMWVAVAAGRSTAGRWAAHLEGEGMCTEVRCLASSFGSRS